MSNTDGGRSDPYVLQLKQLRSAALEWFREHLGGQPPIAV